MSNSTIQNAVTDKEMEIFEKLRVDNQEAIQSYMQGVGDRAFNKKFNKPIANEASVREDMAMMDMIERGLQELEETIHKKNRCSISEYSNKFILLHQFFETSGYTDKKEFLKAREVISKEFMERFSLTHPIELYEDSNPNVTIVAIPPYQKELNLINSNDNWAVDQFIKFGTFDRPDIAQGAQSNLVLAAVKANRVTVDERIAEHAKMTADIIKVLKVFAPNHPLLQKVNAIDNKDEKASDTKEEIQETVKKEEIKHGVVKGEDGTTEIGDLSADDFGF